MADINTFLSRVLANGVQRTNRYRCILDLGQFTDFTVYPAVQQLLREGLLCRTTMTPTRSLETTTVDLSAGYEEKYAISTSYTDIDCTFLSPLIDGKNQVLSLFHAWQNRIQNRGRLNEGDSADMVLAFPNTYRLTQGMTLELLSQDSGREEIAAPNNPNSTATFTGGVINQPATSASFQYFNVYPISVAGTTVDWAMMDEMMEVSVTFSFTHWQQVV
jgi:hypothetical protein